ncbi:MAG: lysophospholipid acyltransferase family protein [Kiritimatiellae bacterium]|jgi:KDO2-lipid IV(A) lauroyltransferase|nr:lysophospholipid acyltransferase family protein [Kiritimatiellia bacterium]
MDKKNNDTANDCSKNSAYFVFLTIIFLTKVLPRQLGYWIALRMAYLKAKSDKKGFAAVKSNLRHIYEYKNQPVTDKELSRKALEVYRNFGKYLIDFFYFTPMTPRQLKKYVDFQGEEYIKEAVSHGKGTILLTAHFGNWEIGAGTITTAGYPIVAVVLEDVNAQTSMLLNVMRMKRGIHLVSLGNAGKTILKTLKDKKNVALMGDRDYSNKGEKFEFLGRMAYMPSGPARLSIKTGAPVVFGRMSRQKKDNFLLDMCPPIYPENHDFESLQRKICKTLEKIVLEYPEQWYILYDFWNEKPVQS